MSPTRRAAERSRKGNAAADTRGAPRGTRRRSLGGHEPRGAPRGPRKSSCSRRRAMSPEARSEASRKARAASLARTPEARRAGALKSWEATPREGGPEMNSRERMRDRSLPGTARALQISETTLKRYFRKHPKLKAAATAGRSVDRLGRVKWDGKAEGE